MEVENKKFTILPSIIYIHGGQHILIDNDTLQKLQNKNLLPECRSVPFDLYKKKFTHKLKRYNALVFDKEYQPLDEERSEFRIFGPVKSLVKAVFINNKIPNKSIFRVGLYHYCTQDFKNFIETSNFSNFLFEEIETN